MILDKEKRVSLKSSPGLLAGAGKTLLENIEYFFFHGLTSLATAWKMASTNASKMLAENNSGISIDTNDFVMFKANKEEIQISTVVKKGKIVFKG